MSRKWVTGCTHFDDIQVLNYRKRFTSLEDMNEQLATSWEEQVSPDDVVYILGDFAADRIVYWTERLPGRKILIEGNHDRLSILHEEVFERIEQQVLLRVPSSKPNEKPSTFFMSHYPMVSWPEKQNGCIHVHAHSHGQGLKRGQKVSGPMKVDVSIDCWDSWPVPIEQVKSLVKS